MSTATTTANPLASARARLREWGDKLKTHPRAICSVCGGIVEAGFGELDARAAATPADAERGRALLPPLLGWSRRHTGCGDYAKAVYEITGRRVSEHVAELAVGRVRYPLEAYARTYAASMAYDPDFRELRGGRIPAVPELRGKAWAHIDDNERAELAAAVKDAERDEWLRTTPHCCTDGPCGACGVAKSLRWFASPLKWSDGSKAPYCADCGKVASGRPSTTDIRRLRIIGLEALSGASGMHLEVEYGATMRLFCELVEPGHEGTAERWQLDDAAGTWAVFRERARRSGATSLRDPDLKAHYMALNAAEAAAERARAQHDAQREAAAAEKAAGWSVER